MATTNATLTKAEPITLPPLPWADNALEPFIDHGLDGQRHEVRCNGQRHQVRTMGRHMRSDAMKSGRSPEQVKAVRQALKDKGNDPGEIDGRMSPKTQAALRDFQQKQGLKATGRADVETMAKLGVEAKTGAVDSSPGAKQAK